MLTNHVYTHLNGYIRYYRIESRRIVIIYVQYAAMCNANFSLRRYDKITLVVTEDYLGFYEWLLLVIGLGLVAAISLIIVIFFCTCTVSVTIMAHPYT